jgi:CBS domain-containing protein
MNDAALAAPSSRLVLEADTAAELMRPNPPAISDRATIAEAIALFTDRGVSAAAVVDAGGWPVGVLSRSDLLIHEREALGQSSPADPPAVRDVMTPAVFAVPPDFPAADVVADLLRLNVRQLYVVDRNGALVGVVDALDVLSHLRAGAP